MINYHLCIQSDGQVVLDREICGDLVSTIAVEDPPMDWGWEKESQEWRLRPAYYQAFEQARSQVTETDYDRKPAGWFKRDN
jgi:hypothetical protein